MSIHISQWHCLDRYIQCPISLQNLLEAKNTSSPLCINGSRVQDMKWLVCFGDQYFSHMQLHIYVDKVQLLNVLESCLLTSSHSFLIAIQQLVNILENMDL